MIGYHFWFGNFLSLMQSVPVVLSFFIIFCCYFFQIFAFMFKDFQIICIHLIVCWVHIENIFWAFSDTFIHYIESSIDSGSSSVRVRSRFNAFANGTCTSSRWRIISVNSTWKKSCRKSVGYGTVVIKSLVFSLFYMR